MTHCDWTQDGDEESDTWGTGCGELFCLNEGDPFDNNMKYCPYCGKPLSVTPLIWDEENGIILGKTKLSA